MVTHVLKIGQRIFDTYDKRWGKVLLIGGKDEDKIIRSKDADMIILYKPDDSDGECETTAAESYPLVEGRYFWGEEVCTEINVDEFDDDHDYDFYCPERDENCWDFEC